MLSRVLVFLLSPVAVLVAQTTPIRITITTPNDGVFRILRASDSPTRALFGHGTLEMMSDSSTTNPSDVVAVLAKDSLSRVHVEAREGSRVVASGDGAFVTIRRDAGVVFIESRSRAPSSFGAANLRRP
jgi:hypothetical protein